jgi:glycosyltransferase involved in cell wall biosynthesis
MAVLAVVTSSPPGVEGGHLVIARALVAAAQAAGHNAHLVVTPDYGFGRFAASYAANWRTDVSEEVGRPVDQVISLRYPSYAVRHPAHICWLNHTIREYYDLWPRFSDAISPRARWKERVRKGLIHTADWWLLRRNVTKVFAQSRTIERRLVTGLGLHTDVVYPPPPPRAYRCDGYGGYIFAVSRLTALKRIDLLIRALAEPTAVHARAVIAGDGEERPALESLAAALGVGDRVVFTGPVSNAALLDHLSRCRAVYFAPLDEDYGFVTVEAFASRKAVLTSRDSGGPAELVRDGETGLVCEPTPSSVAVGLARLLDDPALAERLGAAAARQVAAMSWPAVVQRLVIV